MKNLLNISSEKLKELGVLDWGYVEGDTPETLSHYKEWLKKDYHKPLEYMGDERAVKREKLTNYYSDYQSALVFLFPYIDEKAAQQKLETKKKISAYAYAFEGIDYHYAIKDKLEKIVSQLELENLEVSFSIDAQPVLERDLAYRAGLGWFGKNSMIINREHGSYFLISSILINQKLPVDRMVIETDHCGNCTACIDDCPTNAIEVETRSVITEKCISTYTIELFRNNTPAPSGYENQDYIFGCDICQEVCPWNKKPIELATPKNLNELLIKTSNLKNIEELKSQSKRGFRKIFDRNPIARTGQEGFLKNIKLKD